MSNSWKKFVDKWKIELLQQWPVGAIGLIQSFNSPLQTTIYQVIQSSYRSYFKLRAMFCNELSQYMAYRNNIKRQLLIVGLWPNSDPTHLYRFLPWIFLMLSICTTCAIFGYVRTHFSNVALVTKGLGIMVGYMAVCLKITWIVINRDGVNQLHENLDPHFNELSSGAMSKIALKGASTLWNLSWVFTFLVGLSTTFYVGVPVISIIYQHTHHIQPVKYMLVYPTEYPWNIDPPGYRYKIPFILESAATLGLFCVTVGIDSLFAMYGWQMIAQFREMSHRITHISDKNDRRDILRKCIVQHQKIIKCRDILQKVYGPIILWIITTNAVILCSLIFQLTKTKGAEKALFFAAYIILKIIQTYMYSWTGAHLTEASDDYREAVYGSNWFGNKSLMSSIIIILTQKPLILTACSFSNVTLDLFVMVLNTTMSYFFLLRTLEDNV